MRGQQEIERPSPTASSAFGSVHSIAPNVLHARAARDIKVKGVNSTGHCPERNIYEGEGRKAVAASTRGIDEQCFTNDTQLKIFLV
ncbi:hypothetical protein QE152_g27113 [Popillia japonica]|uniref:Uncharacterized protein n=1 Tax=Popillia japonica TaxID=7064 RepID=A0AAW1JWN8_POPJA